MSASTQNPRLGDAQLFGVLLMLGGISWILHQTGVVSISIPRIVAILLTALGIGMMLTRKSGGRKGLIFLGCLSIVFLALFSKALDPPPTKLVGEELQRPRTASELEAYSLGAGELTVDLTSIALQGDLPAIRARVGVGTLIVIVPTNVNLELKGEVDAGLVSAFHQILDSGTGVRANFSSSPNPSVPTVTLDLAMGIGTIDVFNDLS